jgi:hypothetical protein
MTDRELERALEEAESKLQLLPKPKDSADNSNRLQNDLHLNWNAQTGTTTF